MEKYIVFDIETNGLLDSCDKVHCLSYRVLGEDTIHSITSKDDIIEFFSGENTVYVGHNILMFDIPVLVKLFGLVSPPQIIDTLALSWYLTIRPPTKGGKHGLESWGEYYGTKKKVVEDWENEPISVYIERCESDVKINSALFEDQKKYLEILYGSMKDSKTLLNYLNFKLDTIRIQEENPFDFNEGLCVKTLDILLSKEEQAHKSLIQVLPAVAKYKTYTLPTQKFKKDGDFTVRWSNWSNLLRVNGLPENHTEPILVKVGEEEPNPNSHQQVKEWLYKLGWKPLVHKKSKSTGQDVAQIRVDSSEGKVLCKSVKKLPGTEPLENLSVIVHRKGVLKGFLRDATNKKISGQINSLARSLRLNHKVLVNMPSPKKAYGEEIRGCLTCPDGYEICGSDMASLEDRTKQHFMWEYDKPYVRSMMVEGFDPHLSLAEFEGALSTQDVNFYKECKEEKKITDKKGFARIDKIRHQYKTVNYSATYGIKPKSLSIALDISIRKAATLLKAYWKKNKAIKEIEKDIKTKEIGNTTWMYNPVSRMWYNLKIKKDIFSLLNQSTGDFVFNVWMKEVRKKIPVISLNYHDELAFIVKIGYRKQVTKVLKDAIQVTTKLLKLNRDMDCDVNFGKTYAEVH